MEDELAIKNAYLLLGLETRPYAWKMDTIKLKTWKYTGTQYMMQVLAINLKKRKTLFLDRYAPGGAPVAFELHDDIPLQYEYTIDPEGRK